MKRLQARSRARFWGAVGVTFLLSALVYGAVIDKVVITSDVTKQISEELIRANIRSAAGKTFDPQVLSEDIKRLYKVGDFEDVRTSVTEVPDDKVVVTISVTQKRVVRQILIEGNQRLKTKRLRALVEHKEGVTLDEARVTADANAIRKRYHDKGYYRTDVQPIIQNIPGTHEANIVFRISEEDRSKLKRVEFAGNKSFSAAELRKKIKTRRPWWRTFIPWGGYLDANQFQMDKTALRSFYTSKGYLDFSVDKIEELRGKDNKGKTVVVFHVTEGPVYRVSSLKLVGNKRFSEEELRRLVRLGSEMTYDSDLEEADLKRIEAKYEVLGYLDLKCYPVRTTDSAKQTVDIEYRIIEGIPSTIRDVYIAGNEVTKDHVIRREMAIHPGDLADAGKIRATRDRLMNLNYFESVDISPASTEKEDEKDLNVGVKEKKTGQVQLGAGFSSEDAVLGFVEVTQSNFDWQNWPTFRGGGQRLRLRTQVGTEVSDVVLSFTEPWWLDRQLRLDLDLYAHSRSEDQYKQRTLGFGPTVTQPWMKYWRRYVGLHLQEVRLYDYDSDASWTLRQEEGNYNADSVSLGVIRDSRDKYINPTRGSKFTMGTEIESGLIGSYSNVYKFNVQDAKYVPVFKDSVLKLEVGWDIAGKISGDDPAIFDRYFAGGATTIRGFDRHDVSPVDENGDPMGGKARLLGTVEYIYPIFKIIRGSVFTDAGNVWENIGDTNPTDVNVSIGLGLQLDLPIGPIRFDYGWPIITQEDYLNKSGKFHFNLGYSF